MEIGLCGTMGLSTIKLYAGNGVNLEAIKAGANRQIICLDLTLSMVLKLDRQTLLLRTQYGPVEVCSGELHST